MAQVGNPKAKGAPATITTADILAANILVVDDKPDNVRLIEGMLRVAGYTSVESTTDPHQAANSTGATATALSSSISRCPEWTDFQVMEGLSEIEVDGYLPVLVLTATGAQAARARSRREGFPRQTVRDGRTAGAGP